jgi:AraC-like DNA-binding protein
MDAVLNSLRIRVFTSARATLGSKWGNRDYRDDVGRLYYAESGEGFVRHHGREYRLRSGRLFLIPAHTVFSYRCPRRLVQHYIHFRAEVFGGLDLFSYLRCDFEVNLKRPRQTLSLLRRMHRIVPSRTPTDQVLAHGLLLQLLTPFMATADPGGLERRREDLLRFRPVLERIEERIGERVRVEDLAALAHLERTYFTRLFERHFGTTPARYMRERRVERAMRMLYESDASLEAIAEALGFTDAFHLSRVFKRSTGVRPSDFRRRPGRQP